MARDKLIDLLTYVQNCKENVGRDIMTFAAFLTDAELVPHIINNAKFISRASQEVLFQRIQLAKTEA